MDNQSVSSTGNPADDLAAIGQLIPQAVATLGGLGTKLDSGYSNGQAAIRARLQQGLGLDELTADKLVKMLIQTNRLQFVTQGDTPPPPQGQANPSSDSATNTADSGDAFSGEGYSRSTETDASGDVSRPPDPASIGYNPLVNIGAEAAPGNVGAVPVVPLGENIGEAQREGQAVSGARAFAPGAIGGTMGYHNAGLMTAPGPIDSDGSDQAGDWYLVG